MSEAFRPFSVAYGLRGAANALLRHLRPAAPEPVREPLPEFDPQEGSAYLPGAVRAWRNGQGELLDLPWQGEGAMRGLTGIAADARHDNVRRAGFAIEALHAYEMTCGGDPDTILTDLIGDLMHLCDAVDENFEDHVRAAYVHYESERLGRL